MNKRHYEHTLPNIRGSLSNTYQKTTGQTASMAHSENMVSRLSTHRKKPLQFLLKK